MQEDSGIIAEQLSHGRHRDASAERERGCRVSTVVQPDLGQAEHLDLVGEPLRDVIAVIGAPELVGDQPAFIRVGPHQRTKRSAAWAALWSRRMATKAPSRGMLRSPARLLGSLSWPTSWGLGVAYLGNRLGTKLDSAALSGAN